MSALKIHITDYTKFLHQEEHYDEKLEVFMLIPVILREIKFSNKSLKNLSDKRLNIDKKTHTFYPILVHCKSYKLQKPLTSIQSMLILPLEWNHLDGPKIQQEAPATYIKLRGMCLK